MSDWCLLTRLVSELYVSGLYIIYFRMGTDQYRETQCRSQQRWQTDTLAACSAYFVAASPRVVRWNSSYDCKASHSQIRGAQQREPQHRVCHVLARDYSVHLHAAFKQTIPRARSQIEW